jgi:hypothetical protein
VVPPSDDEFVRPPDPTPVRDSEAEYALEYPCVCPHCGHTLHAVRVIRLLRIRVNFTSTLPRRGRVIVCPDCRKMLSAELGGIA